MVNKELIPPGLTCLADNITSKDNLLSASKRAGTKWAKDLKLPREMEAIFFAGIGAVWAAMISRNKEKAASIAYTCLTCGRCKVRCPVQIDTAAMCVELRKLIVEGD